MCREYGILEHSVLHVMSPSIPSPLGSENPVEKETEWMYEQKGMDDTQEQTF